MNLKHGLTGLVACSAIMLGTAVLAPAVSFAQNESNWRSQWKLEPIEIAIDLYEEKINSEIETTVAIPEISDEELNELQFFIDSQDEKKTEPLEIQVPVKSEKQPEEVAKAEEKTEEPKDFKTEKKVDQTTLKPAIKVESPKSSGRYQLGISLTRLSKSTREKYKIPSDVGYGIRYVQDDSAADKAGLKKSDIIVGLGKKSVKSYSDLVKAVQNAGSDKKTLKLWILRDGKKKEVSVQPLLAMKRSRSSSDKKSHSHSHRGHSDMRERMKSMFESLSKDDQSKVKKIIEEMKDIRTKAMKNKGKLSDKDKSRARELMGLLMKMRSKIGGSTSKESSSRRAEYMKKMKERMEAAKKYAKAKKPECKGEDCKKSDCKDCDGCKKSGCKDCKSCKKSECNGKDCKDCDKCKGSKSGHHSHKGHHHCHKGRHHGHHGDKKDDHHGHRGHHGPPPHHAHRGPHHGHKPGAHRGPRHGRPGGHHGMRGGKMRAHFGMMHLVKRLVDKIEDLTETVEELTEQVEELTEQLEEIEEKLDD